MKKLNDFVVSIRQSISSLKLKMQACDFKAWSTEILQKLTDGAARRKKLVQNMGLVTVIAIMLSSMVWVPVNCNQGEEGQDFMVASDMGATNVDMMDVASTRMASNVDTIKMASASVDVPKKTEKKKPVIKIKYKTVNVPIRFSTITKTSRGLYLGRTKILRHGKNGTRKYKYKLTYRNGKLKSKKLVKNTVVSKPVAQIVQRGTNNVAHLPNGDKVRIKRVFIMEATAYSCDGRKEHTASGAIAQVGYVAVDPRVIPLGTKLFIQSLDGTGSYGYAVAKDTGGAIKGNKIDLYFDTTKECFRYGRRNVKVYVLK